MTTGVHREVGEVNARRKARLRTARHPVAGPLSTVVLALAASALALPAQDTASVAPARVRGTVFDSVARHPLGNATVQLVSAQDARIGWTTQSTAAGAFAFDSVPAGTFFLGFHHPSLDSLALEPRLLQLTTRPGATLQANLAIPSPATLRTTLCGADAVRDSVTLMQGYVRSSLTGAAAAGAEVMVQWTEIALGRGGIYGTPKRTVAETTAEGGFAVCGLPASGSVQVQAWSAAGSSGLVDFDIPENQFIRRDLYVGPSVTRTIAIAPDSGAENIPPFEISVMRGDERVRGMVRRSEGTPIAGARLAVSGSGFEATTGSDGTFTFDSLPAGTQTLEVRALGFLPMRHLVDVMVGSVRSTDVVLESFGVFLDTVKVRAERAFTSKQLEEFEKRRRFGNGFFLNEDEIERRNPLFATDLVREAAGVHVLPATMGRSQVLMRAPGGGVCRPAVFVDGQRILISGDDHLDQFVNSQDVRGIEVYSRQNRTPLEFTSLVDGCGSIVFWTGGRRVAPRQQRATTNR